MADAVTEPSGFASKWLPFQTAKRHVTIVKKPAKMFALSGWTQIAVYDVCFIVTRCTVIILFRLLLW